MKMMKTSPKLQARQIGAAATFVDEHMSLERVAFSLEELANESGWSAIAAKFQLLRLRGKVVRVSWRPKLPGVAAGDLALSGLAIKTIEIYGVRISMSGATC